MRFTLRSLAAFCDGQRLCCAVGRCLVGASRTRRNTEGRREGKGKGKETYARELENLRREVL